MSAFTKVVYNARHGGFGLSHEAIMRYAEIKGLTLYPEETRWSRLAGLRYWTVPPAERPAELEGLAWAQATLEERAEHNRRWDETTLDTRRIERTDPALAQAVEELGDKASGRFAQLAIAEVRKGERYRIDEYDGFESVQTVDSYDWKVA